MSDVVEVFFTMIIANATPGFGRFGKMLNILPS